MATTKPMSKDALHRVPNANEELGGKVAAAMRRATERIAPTWPLDRFIAVNPFWGMIDKPLPRVSTELAALSGARLLMPRAYYRQAFEEGRFGETHLREAIARRGLDLSVERALVLLRSEEPRIARRARVMDVVDAQRDLVYEMSFREYVTYDTSQFCAAYFDESQSSLGPDREGGLYASWRRKSLHDRSPGLLMGLRGFRSTVRELPETAFEMARLALDELDLPEREWETYLLGLLLDLNGWAAVCAYRRFVARLEGSDDHALEELLAIRLAWELILFRNGGRSVASRWQLAMASFTAVDTGAQKALAQDWIFQEALELAYQEELCRALPAGFEAEARADVAVQAVFCIDVRSEVFRRALERETTKVETLGFAGFFGLPIEYRPLGQVAARPQLPGPLAPKMTVTDTTSDPELHLRREERLGVASAFRAFKTGPVSSFAFVESMGLFAAGSLVRETLGLGRTTPPDHAGLSRHEAAERRPRLASLVGGAPLEASAKVDLAAGMLRAMSLAKGFARLVLLVGHGSDTRNNPHAAGLDCGACCGRTGEVNARAAAALLNEPAVRAGLAERGIHVPATTRFVAALHHTTTDEVELFETEDVPASHAGDLHALRGWLASAGSRARRERAAKLGLSSLDDAALAKSMTARSRDWSEVRPEWGLADNAVFVIAPRERSRHMDLGGRSFLHDYRHAEDAGYGILELLLTAPMVVTHWINLQYYASTVDNLRYGSGNKVLHNVVGGRIGVFEGNAGDLRIGLSMQSLHDGERFVHTPRRLSVFVEAPREAIDGIVARHETVRRLVENGWVHLFQLDGETKQVFARRGTEWAPTSTDD